MLTYLIVVAVAPSICIAAGTGNQASTPRKSSIFSSLSAEECIQDLGETVRDRNALLQENARLKREMLELLDDLAKYLEIIENYKEIVKLLRDLYQ